MGTCGLVGQIGVYTGWLNDIAAGDQNSRHRYGLAGPCAHLLRAARLCFLLLFDLIFRKIGWVKDGDMKIDA